MVVVVMVVGARPSASPGGVSEARGALERLAPARLVLVVRVVLLVLQAQAFCLVHKRALLLLAQHPGQIHRKHG